DMMTTRLVGSALSTSWPGLSRPSRFSRQCPSYRDRRDKPGDDGGVWWTHPKRSRSRRNRRDRDEDGANLVGAVDDLAPLLVAAVVLPQHGLRAADDHGELALQHIIYLLRRRGVGPCAAARQEVRHAGDDGFRHAGLGAEQAKRRHRPMVRRVVGFGFGKLLD